MWKTGADTSLDSFTPRLSFRLVITAFENFEYLWDVQDSTLILICLLHGMQVSFRVKQLFQNITQRSSLGLDSYEWLGVWGSMGKYIGLWARPVFLNLTPEQVQNPDKLIKDLEEVCYHPGNSSKTQNTAKCWGFDPCLPSRPVQQDAVKGENESNRSHGFPSPDKQLCSHSRP